MLWTLTIALLAAFLLSQLLLWAGIAHPVIHIGLGIGCFFSARALTHRLRRD